MNKLNTFGKGGMWVPRPASGFYTDISCVRGVFAKYTSQENKNFPDPEGRGKLFSRDWYILQIPLSHMVDLFNYTEYL